MELAPKKVRVGLLVVAGLLLAATGPRTTHGQTGRDALFVGNDAAGRFDYATAVRMLSRGLAPDSGRLDNTWMVGVHKLTESLLETGRDSLAVVWCRWAARLKSDIVVNDVDFTADVVGVLEDARTFVEITPHDVLVAEIGFEWGSSAGAARRGWLLLEEMGVSAPGMIEQPRQRMNPGQAVALEPGSYTVQVNAAGVLGTSFTAEVLPGVTTSVRLNLLSEDAGYLYVTSRPWARVSVDGKWIGYTTIAGRRIAPGEHVIRISHDDYVAVDSTITIGPNERLRLGPVLLRPWGR